MEDGWMSGPTWYQLLKWTHDNPESPVEIWSEIRGDREVRKVEVFKDGTLRYASEFTDDRDPTGLSEVPMLRGLPDDEVLRSWEITRDQFERTWLAASAEQPAPSGRERDSSSTPMSTGAEPGRPSP